MSITLFDSHLPGLKPLYRGKVRDLYEIDEKHMLIVTTDRISAFDVVLPTPIPEKGAVLTRISNFWFKKFENLVANHLADLSLEEVFINHALNPELVSRSVVVKKLRALPIEAIVRGYLIGSGWKDYMRSGRVCGLALPAGLRLADRLPEPIFTPSTKAALGGHDVNVDFAHVVNLIGSELSSQLRDTSLEIYRQAQAYAREQGIIIADTKFEFAQDEDGKLVLIDEALTPDSSRFWPVESYRPDTNPPSFDKQYVRDYLESLDWDKTDPGPTLPLKVVEKTTQKYRLAQHMLLN